MKKWDEELEKLGVFDEIDAELLKMSGDGETSYRWSAANRIREALRGKSVDASQKAVALRVAVHYRKLDIAAKIGDDKESVELQWLTPDGSIPLGDALGAFRR